MYIHGTYIDKYLYIHGTYIGKYVYLLIDLSHSIEDGGDTLSLHMSVDEGGRSYLSSDLLPKFGMSDDVIFTVSDHPIRGKNHLSFIYFNGWLRETKVVSFKISTCFYIGGGMVIHPYGSKRLWQPPIPIHHKPVRWYNFDSYLMPPPLLCCGQQCFTDDHNLLANLQQQTLFQAIVCHRSSQHLVQKPLLTHENQNNLASDSFKPLSLPSNHTTMTVRGIAGSLSVEEFSLVDIADRRVYYTENEGEIGVSPLTDSFNLTISSGRIIVDNKLVPDILVQVITQCQSLDGQFTCCQYQR